jgi:single-strand DNA-binding protein
MQKIILVGRVGQDPALRYTPDGTAVASFSMATTETWNGKDGQKNKETTWWKVTVWRRMAEVVNQYLSKGRQVAVEGRVSGDKLDGANAGEKKVVPHTWLTEGGEPRAQFEITASNIEFLGGRGDNGGSDAPAGPAEEEEPLPF